VAVAGRALCTQLAAMSNPDVRSGNLIKDLTRDRHKRNRLLTMPGDELYVMVVAEVVGVIGDENVKQVLRNIRLEISTSEELSKYSTPKDGFEGRLKATMGLADEEVIVGAWRLARVVDNSATRPTPRNGFDVSRNPNSMGLETVVDIKWKSSVDLHLKYWKPSKATPSS